MIISCTKKMNTLPVSIIASLYPYFHLNQTNSLRLVNHEFYQASKQRIAWNSYLFTSSNINNANEIHNQRSVLEQLQPVWKRKPVSIDHTNILETLNKFISVFRECSYRAELTIHDEVDLNK